MLFLDRDKAHAGTRHGFADGRSIRCIVLAALAAHAIGRDELGCHQPHGMAVLAKRSGPVVRTCAGFHADQAGRHVDDQWQ